MPTANVTIGNYYVFNSITNVVESINPSSKRLGVIDINDNNLSHAYYVLAEVNLPYLETKSAKTVVNFTGQIATFNRQYEGYEAYNEVDITFVNLKNTGQINIGDYLDYSFRMPDNKWRALLGQYTRRFGTTGSASISNEMYLVDTYLEKQYVVIKLIGTYNSPWPQSFNNLSIPITYTEATSFDGTLYPQSSFVDYSKDTAFNVEINMNAVYVKPIMTSGKLFYKKQSESTYRNVSFTGYTGTIPANTFENGFIYDVYAELTSQNGHKLTTPSVTYTTVDSIPSVEGISPSNQITNGDINFAWNYTNETGTSQYAYDIQYSTDQSTWTTLANHVVSSSTNYQGSISTLGTLYWRVRGYNQNDVAGAWSTPLMFINRVAPNAPVIISVTQSGRPFINWSATGQTAFEIVVEDAEGNAVFESGIIPSTANQYLINEYLPNGQYLIKLKIQNVFGDESDYATYSYFQNIDYSQIGYPVFNLQATDNGVMINITHDDTFSYYYLQRNGITIAKITDDQYLDKFANGITEYTLLGVTSTDLFSSTTNTIDATVKFTRLIGLDGTVFDIHERRGAPVDVQKSYEVDFEEAQYLGARLPEINTSKFRRRTYTVAFYYPQDLEILMGETFLYADVYGNRDWVVLVGANKLERRAGNDISVQLNTCNYSEGIEYDL